jgi:hypothetical protein
MSGFAEVGSLDQTIGGWTDNQASSACSAPSRIYCFGIGNQVAVGTSPATGRRAFLSTAVSITSLAALDAHCAQDASTAGVAGTFLALVATSTTSAIGRFDTTGGALGAARRRPARPECRCARRRPARPARPASQRHLRDDRARVDGRDRSFVARVRRILRGLDQREPVANGHVR